MCKPLWYLYLIEAGDGRLYTGISTEPKRRLRQHEQGTGARFLRGRGPLRLCFVRAVGDRRCALRLEYQVKQWPRQAKLALIAGERELPVLESDA